MIELSLPIEKLKSVGPRNLPRLHKLGIKTVRDLLWHFPARYDDYSRILPIAELQPDLKVNIQGQVMKINTRWIFPRHITVIDAVVKDDTGAVRAVWFNQPYIANTLAEGTRVSLAGTVKLDKRGLYLASPVYEKIYNDNDNDYYAYNLTHTQGLVPVYPETEGVTSKYLRFLIKPLIDQISIPESLPKEITERNNFLSLSEAVYKIHYPLNVTEAEKAKERLAFDDLLLFQIKALLERRKINQLKSLMVPFNKEIVTDFISRLPFELTKDQKIAAWEILKDLERTYPMNRLLEGDVGSGKTVVALIAAIQVAHCRLPDGSQGCQTVFMAPTEVLANQHYETITSLISNFQFPISNQIPNSKSQIRIGLLTSSEAKLNNKAVKRTDLKKKIAEGEIDVIIGTHALIQKDVKFNKLALVIIDEQHRFGVHQRASLVKDGVSSLIPHLLSMTATPIPRTLALTIYGDLDISLIKEKPANRPKIITKVIPPSGRNGAYQFIRSEVKAGRQVFVICPRIELANPNKKLDGRGSQSKMNILWADMKAVQEEYKKLSEQTFPDLKVAMLHGKMKSKEKNEIMTGFKNGSADVLVSTSVIEVGIDIPNATIMMIENADRFGLAQLHQFRGRIGRGEHRSSCLLFTSSAEKSINQRLKALIDTDDGFVLAEKDMAIRGPGEFFGSQQSGLPDLAMASLANVELIKKARLEARFLLKKDPSMNNYPLLKDRLEQFRKLTHFE